VVAVSDCSSSPVTPMQTPDTSSGKRVPRFATRRPDSGLNTAVTAAIGRVNRPAFIAEYARTSCRYSVLRNRNPASAMKAHTAMTVAPLNGIDLKKRSSISGSSRRPS
jgi:hypothetical protein